MSEPAIEEMSAAGSRSADLYERDYYSWVEEQVALLRAGRWAEVDAGNVAEELSDMGKAHFYRLQSSLKILVMHMLKWDQQTEHRSSSWQGSIREHRRRINKLLARNPGLKARAAEALADGYDDALVWAAEETGLPEDEFPKTCPYDWDDILERPFQLDQPLERR